MKFVMYFVILSNLLILSSCGENDERKEGEVAYSESKDQSIQSYNLEVEKKSSAKRIPCDTLALKEYILNNYPAGSYLVDFDRTLTYNVPKSAVIYYKADANYVFAVVAKSKPGERLIDVKNVTGFESSFINLDSTELGTAFFYMTLFECRDENFEMLWEREIPLHGGFNKITYKTWKKKTPYIEANFEDGIIVGHRNFNYFMVDGIRSYPHLLETYEGLSKKRTMAYVNEDVYPDYFEFVFYNLADRIYSVDSVAFTWDVKKKLYVNVKNQRQTRPY